jgi:hypothetical protein
MKFSKIIKFIIVLSISFPVYSNNGIWEGIFDINGHGSYDFTGLINSKYASAYTKKAKVVYSGTFKEKNNYFTWSLSMYLKDGTKFGTAEIKGKIIDKNIMSGKWTTEPAKDYGNIYLIKKNNTILNTGKIINRKWIAKETNIKQKIIIKDNKIIGKDNNNCNYYGEIKPLNKKIYTTNIEIASCGVSDGIYSGMAHIKKDNEKYNLFITGTNKNFSLFMMLE